MNIKQIFVFGSNTEGIHGAGAALCALTEHGAIRGVPMGLQGNAYGIITKDLRVGARSISLEAIKAQVTLLAFFALYRKDLNFNVTRIGCGHAGYTEDEIAPMFAMFKLLDINNVCLCPEFEEYLKLHP